MADYRVYFLDQDGHIGRAFEFVRASDDAAIETAERMADGRAIELWQLKRRVITKPARPEGRSASSELDPRSGPS